MNKAIVVFVVEFSGCQALFMFDNTKNYIKFANDVLRVSNMNLDKWRKECKADAYYIYF
ncbi:hypothetical protein L873DRAFT_1673496 [Choiromyces venosus 120613-1]|uniref:Uncharacterized protein n=1 Tax=Choiromyces venosus 120613-1 TaxID=1336337 RepID=A0A3N4JV76_9PEZI|nr:hypothetical protein L873DRAFT_1673496 [Choiromyces venosus 120613-1]